MLPTAKFQGYLDRILTHVHCKQAKEVVADELLNHLEDQKDAFITEGMPEEEAIETAILEMGDPDMIGKQLDQLHRPKIQWSVFFLIGVILITSVIIEIVFPHQLDTENAYFLKKIISIVAGLGSFFLFYFMDYRWIARFSKWIYIVLLICSAIIYIGSPEVNGNRFYISGNVYCSVLLFAPVFAGIIYYRRNSGIPGIFYCILYCLPIGIIAINSFTSFIQIGFTCFIVLLSAIYRNWFGNNRKKQILILLSSIFAVAIMLIFTSSIRYRLDRIFIFFNPYSDPAGRGYQVIILQKILQNSKWIGQTTITLGEAFSSIAPQASLSSHAPQLLYNCMPEITTNFLLVGIIAKYGRIAGFFIIAVMAILIIKLYKTTFQIKNPLGFLIACACTTILSIQSILFIGANLGISFITPMLLPFISYSFSAMVTNMAILGLMLGVFRRKDIIKEPAVNEKKHSWIELEKGRITIHY